MNSGISNNLPAITKLPSIGQSNNTLSSLPSMSSIKNIYGQDTKTYNYYKQKYAEQQEVEEKATHVSELYNTEQVNSLADVITRGIAASDGNGIINKAFLSANSELFQRLWKYPIKDKSPLEFVNNQLISLGETMDFISGFGALKALLPSSITTAGSDFNQQNSTAVERISNFYGLGSDSLPSSMTGEHYNYDYDFDFNGDRNDDTFSELVVDTLAEVMTDPLNSIEMLGEFAAKPLAKVRLRNAAKDIDGFKNLTGFQNRILARNIVRNYLAGDNAAVNKDVYNFLSRNISGIKDPEQYLKAKNYLNEDKISELTEALIKRADDTATHKININMLRGLYGLNMDVSTWDSMLTAASGGLLTPLFFGGVILGGTAVKYAGTQIVKISQKYAAPYQQKLLALDIFKVNDWNKDIDDFFNNIKDTKKVPGVFLNSKEDLKNNLIANSLFVQADKALEIMSGTAVSDKEIISALEDYVFSITNGSTKDLSEWISNCKELIENSSYLRSMLSSKYNRDILQLFESLEDSYTIAKEKDTMYRISEDLTQALQNIDNIPELTFTKNFQDYFSKTLTLDKTTDELDQSLYKLHKSLASATTDAERTKIKQDYEKVFLALEKERRIHPQSEKAVVLNLLYHLTPEKMSEYIYKIISDLRESYRLLDAYGKTTYSISHVESVLEDLNKSYKAFYDKYAIFKSYFKGTTVLEPNSDVPYSIWAPTYKATHHLVADLKQLPTNMTYRKLEGKRLRDGRIYYRLFGEDFSSPILGKDKHGKNKITGYYTLALKKGIDTKYTLDNISSDIFSRIFYSDLPSIDLIKDFINKYNAVQNVSKVVSKDVAKIKSVLNNTNYINQAFKEAALGNNLKVKEILDKLFTSSLSRPYGLKAGATIKDAGIEEAVKENSKEIINIFQEIRSLKDTYISNRVTGVPVTIEAAGIDIDKLIAEAIQEVDSKYFNSFVKSDKAMELVEDEIKNFKFSDSGDLKISEYEEICNDFSEIVNNVRTKLNLHLTGTAEQDIDMFDKNIHISIAGSNKDEKAQNLRKALKLQALKRQKQNIPRSVRDEILQDMQKKQSFSNVVFTNERKYQLSSEAYKSIYKDDDTPERLLEAFKNNKALFKKEKGTDIVFNFDDATISVFKKSKDEHYGKFLDAKYELTGNNTLTRNITYESLSDRFSKFNTENNPNKFKAEETNSFLGKFDEYFHDSNFQDYMDDLIHNHITSALPIQTNKNYNVFYRPKKGNKYKAEFVVQFTGYSKPKEFIMPAFTISTRAGEYDKILKGLTEKIDKAAEVLHKYNDDFSRIYLMPREDRIIVDSVYGITSLDLKSTADRIKIMQQNEKVGRTIDSMFSEMLNDISKMHDFKDTIFMNDKNESIISIAKNRANQVFNMYAGVVPTRLYNAFQNYNSYEYKVVKRFREAIQGIDNFKEYATTLDELMSDVDYLSLQSSFVQRAAALLGDIEVTEKFIDAFQQYAMAPLDVLKKPSTVTSLLASTENQLYNAFSTKRLAVDNFRETVMYTNDFNNKLTEWYPEMLTNSKEAKRIKALKRQALVFGHDNPEADNIAAIWALRYYSPEKYEDLARRNADVFDLETITASTDLADPYKYAEFGEKNSDNGIISQVAVTNINTFETKVIRLEGCAYNINVPEAVMAKDEAGLINAFLSEIKNTKALAGMNSDAFDVKFLNTRIEANLKLINMEDPGYINFRKLEDKAYKGYADITDMLRCIKESLGIPLITPDQRTNIEKVINMYCASAQYYHKAFAQGIKPQRIIDNLTALKELDRTRNFKLSDDEITAQLLDKGIDIETLSDIDKDIYRTNTATEHNSAINEFLNLLDEQFSAEDLSDYTRSYLNEYSDSGYLWDIYKTTATPEIIKEAMSRLHHNMSDFKDLLKKRGLSKQDISLWFSGKGVDKPGHDIVTDKISKVWRELELYRALIETTQPLQEGKVFPIPSEEQFSKFLRDAYYGGREEISNFAQLFSDIGEESPINIRNYYNANLVFENNGKSYLFKDFSGPIKSKDMLGVMHKQREINSIIENIRSVDGIFNIGLKYTVNGKVKTIVNFNTLKEAVHSILSDTTKLPFWARQLDESKIVTEAQNFAVYYAIVADSNYDIANIEQHVFADKVIKDQLKAEVLQKVSDSVFMKQLSDTAFNPEEYIPVSYRITQTKIYKNANHIDRMKLIINALASDANADTKHYIVKQLQEPMYKLATKFADMSSVNRMRCSKMFNDAFEEVNNSRKLDTLTKALYGGDTDYIIKKLMSGYGVIKFSLPDLELFTDDASDIIKSYLRITNAIRENIEDLEKVGVHYSEIDSYGYLYLDSALYGGRVNDLDDTFVYAGKTYALNDDNIILNFDSDRYFYKHNGSAQGEPINVEVSGKEYFEDLNNMINSTAARSNYRGWGDAITSTKYEYLYNRLPTEIQQKVLTPDQFDKSTILDELRFGDFDYTISDLKYSNPSKHPLEALYDNISYTLENRATADIYMDYITNPTYNMNFREGGFLDGLSEEEQIQYFKQYGNSETPAVRIVKDTKPFNSKQGYHAQRIVIHNAESLRLARESDAVIMPYSVYSTAFTEINNNADALICDSVLMSKAVKFYRKAMLAYKVLYLVNPATWVRNFIDSNTKAIIDTNDPIGMVKNTVRSIQYYNKYNEVTKDIIKYIKVKGDRGITTTNILNYFRLQEACHNKTALTRNEYLFMHSFIINGPSTGETYVLKKYIKAMHKEKSLDSTALQNPINSLTNILLSPMGFIESRSRFAQYLTLVDQGIVGSTAFKRVADTAFDYSVKSKIDRFIENVIPFYTFQKLNLQYWIESLEHSPALCRALENFMQFTWGTFDMSPEEFFLNQSLQYNVMAGNVRLEDDVTSRSVANKNGETDFTLKINPSYMDAFKLLLEPIYAYSSTNDDGTFSLSKYGEESNIIGSMFAPIQNLISCQEVEAMFAHGLWAKDEEGAAYWRKACESVLHDVSTYPGGAILQRNLLAPDEQSKILGSSVYKSIYNFLDDKFDFTNNPSAKQKNKTKIGKTSHPLEYTIAQALPGLFGSVVRWEQYKYDDPYKRAVSNYYKYNYRQYSYPDRTYNYYSRYNTYNKFVHNNTYRKSILAGTNVANLRLNIAQLHLI